MAHFFRRKNCTPAEMGGQRRHHSEVLPFKWDERTIRNGLNFTLTTSFGDLDLLGEAAGGGTHDDLLPHSQEVNGFGARFRLIDLDNVREARSIRKARQVGYRNEAFARLKDALALGIAHADASLLRKEAVACLGDWVGLDPVDILVTGRVSCDALTADGALVALGNWNGHVSLHRAQTGREIANLDTTGVPGSLTFDRKGTALFVTVLDGNLEYRKRPPGSHLEKWSVRGDGSWRREWSKPKPGNICCCDTASGPVSLVLCRAASGLVH